MGAPRLLTVGPWTMKMRSAESRRQVREAGKVDVMFQALE